MKVSLLCIERIVRLVNFGLYITALVCKKQVLCAAKSWKNSGIVVLQTGCAHFAK